MFRCPHCRNWEVPFLEVVVKDFRHVPLSQTRQGNLFGLNLASSHESMNLNLNPGGGGRRSSFNPSLLIQNVGNATAIAAQRRKFSLNPSAPSQLDPSHLDNNATTLKTNGKDDTVEMDPLGVLGEKADPNLTDNETPQVVLTLEEEEKISDKVTLGGVDVEGLESDVIIVPYLSPLVLRKELENVLEHEGELINKFIPVLWVWFLLCPYFFFRS